MINLLPPELKSELRAARTNSMLRTYLVTAAAALVAIVGVFAAALYINHMNFIAYEQQRAESEQKLAAGADIKKRIGEYNANLELAKQVFDSEVRLTNLVDNISSTLPPGAVLDNVALDAASFTEPATITARVDSFEKAGVMERNLKQSGLFTKVVLNGVQGQEAEAATEEEAAPSQYPFSALFEVTLGPEAAREGFTPAAGEDTP